MIINVSFLRKALKLPGAECVPVGGIKVIK
jgi:hypothetical protein